MEGESWKQVPQEEREKIRKDPDYCQAAFERILGSPTSDYASSQGYYKYECPFAGCYDSHHAHLGVKYERDISIQGSKCGKWSCMRCGTFGIDFFDFCDQLDKDPKDYLSDIDLEKLSPRKVQEIIPVNPKNFSSVWSWVVQNTSNESDTLYNMLYNRGVQISKTHWFQLPNNRVFDEAINLFGEELCLEAGILKKKNEEYYRTPLANPNSLGIVYPSKLEYEYVRAYNRQKTPKIYGPANYGLRPYVRLAPEDDLVVITEGEIKTEASWQAGISTIGIPGIFNCHTNAADIIKEQSKRLNNSMTVIIVLDTETKMSTILNVLQAKVRIYDKLKEAFKDLPKNLQPQILTGELPLLRGQEKTDIDNFITYHLGKGSLSTARKAWKNWVYQI